ncbi:MAG TPA: GNAT family N-acetyltransferase [Acidimicrobiia bacterium]|nr:GNAT family N-acetyltransferase [Acidimicrobiia bacterium]
MATRTYPSQWESDVVLADGGTVHVRPIRPDDDAALLALYERMSSDSIYLRFFSPVSAPTAQQLERLTSIDYDDRMALVAELADRIVAVARYDRLNERDEAEVAFTVEDDQQGRGLGTIMLEHLAGIARREGIRRFVASTLPSNRKMLDVFRNAGFEVERRFSDGVVELTFPIAPTDASRAAQEEREHQAESRSTARVLAPRSIAVVGAGRRRGTIGHELLRNLIAGGFQGPVYPVNPSTTSVASVRSWPSVLDIPDEVDVAVITVPAPLVEGVVRECAQKRVRGLIVITAGFAETGEDGRRTEREVVELARRHGMRMVGPNCMGVVNTNPDVQMNATFAPFTPTRGRVAFSSQSGALGIELLAQASRLGLGVSSFVSIGNKADVSGNDLLQHWEDDPDTDVILLYLESFGNPRKFARLARRISQRKPIVAVKSGRSRAGTRAASSHTAALASPDVAVDALFRQAGVVRVDTMEQLFETAQVLVNQPLPKGRRVAIISNGGGPGILAADACEGAGLEVNELGPATQQELRSFVSSDASVGNPVDLVASASAETYERAIRTVLRDPEVDALLVIFVPPLVTAAEDVARAIQAGSTEAGDTPVVACFLGRQGVPDALQHPPESADGVRHAIPSFSFPESAVAAMARAAEHGEWRRRPTGTVPSLDGVHVARARELVADVLASAGGERVWLDSDVAFALCDCFGIPHVPVRRVTSPDDAADAASELGFPVALKVAAGSIVHKSDVGGVHLGLRTAEAVRDAYAHIVSATGERDVVVQPIAEAGVETIVGVTHDPSFGPLVLFGMGGVTAELMRDTALRIVPITDIDAHEVVRSLKMSPLLLGYRGSAPVDVDALEDVVLRVGLLADALAEVSEMDCNPVIVTPDGATVVDVKVRLAPPTESPLRGLRRMRAVS